METIECIKTRRSIRKFKPDPIPRDLIMQILDCARHSPSSMHSDAWIFTIITDREQKQELVKLKKYPSEWIVDAPTLVSVSVDLSKSKRWIEDGSIAATMILLAAHDRGLGACWVAMRYEDTALNAKIQKALGVTDSIFPICLIALGYPDEEPKPKQLKDLHSLVR